MTNQEPAVVFDQERASAYDKRFAKLAPLRDAIHLLMHMILSELPTDAHILCVGAGTGAELALSRSKLSTMAVHCGRACGTDA